MRNHPVDEGLRWIEEARHDLRAARLLADAGEHHLACFHAQQAAEKAFKGFLYAQGEEVVLGHAVQRLRDAAQRYDSSLGALPDVRPLDGYYIAPRYPNGVAPDTTPSAAFGRGQSSAAVGLAETIVAAVDRRLTAATSG